MLSISLVVVGFVSFMDIIYGEFVTRNVLKCLCLCYCPHLMNNPDFYYLLCIIHRKETCVENLCNAVLFIHTFIPSF